MSITIQFAIHTRESELFYSVLYDLDTTVLNIRRGLSCMRHYGGLFLNLTERIHGVCSVPVVEIVN